MNKDLTSILTEMCSRVGVDASTFDFEDPTWYTKHQWTIDEEDDFKVWLCRWIAHNRQIARGLWDNVHSLDKKHRMEIANAFVFNYGWSIVGDTLNSKNERLNMEHKSFNDAPYGK